MMWSIFFLHNNFDWSANVKQISQFRNFAIWLMMPSTNTAPPPHPTACRPPFQAVTFGQLEGLWVVLACTVGVALLLLLLPHISQRFEADVEPDHTALSFTQSVTRSFTGVVNKVFRKTASSQQPPREEADNAKAGVPSGAGYGGDDGWVKGAVMPPDKGGSLVGAGAAVPKSTSMGKVSAHSMNYATAEAVMTLPEEADFSHGVGGGLEFAGRGGRDPRPPQPASACVLEEVGEEDNSVFFERGVMAGPRTLGPTSTPSHPVD